MPVTETFQGEMVSQGVVRVFNLIDYSYADQCCAWSQPVDDSENLKFYVVVCTPMANSPPEAVRASILTDEAG